MSCPDFSCLASVSYTHLDVYKRQPLFSQWCLGILPMMPLCRCPETPWHVHYYSTNALIPSKWSLTGHFWSEQFKANKIATTSMNSAIVWTLIFLHEKWAFRFHMNFSFFFLLGPFFFKYKKEYENNILSFVAHKH